MLVVAKDLEDGGLIVLGVIVGCEQDVNRDEVAMQE